MSTNNGFTLLELLMVLMIVMALLIWPFATVKQRYDEQTVIQFTKQLRADYLWMQQMAKADVKPYTLTFFPNEHLYVVTERMKVKKEYRYAHSLRLSFMTLKPDIRFDSQGQTASGGKLLISGGVTEREVTVYFGQGVIKID